MSASTALPYFTADDVVRLLPLDRAMDALEAALRSGLDPEDDGPRLFSPAPRGEFLLLPAQGERFSGLKALTVAPENPARGLEKIQGVYILYSSDTLAPVAILEGASLTAIRTPAVTLSAIRQLAAIAPAGGELPAEPRVLVFGAGTQASAHIRAAALAFPRARFGVVGRRPERVAALIAELGKASETAGSQVGDRGRAPGIEDDAAIAAALAEADIVICATTAHAPLFDGSLVRDDAIVAAVGTHGRELREVDDALVARADIVVEGRASAQRENGNLVSIDALGRDGVSPPANLRELARGEVVRTPGRPAFYTGVGMAWEDLVCATAVLTSSSEEAPLSTRVADSEESA